MNYFDKDRAKLSGTESPLLEGCQTIIPGFYIDLEDSHLVTVTVWLPSGVSTFSAKSITLARFQLEPLLLDYLDNPEKVLKDIFSWTPCSNLEQKKKSQVLTLDDLGL